MKSMWKPSKVWREMKKNYMEYTKQNAQTNSDHNALLINIDFISPGNLLGKKKR